MSKSISGTMVTNSFLVKEPAKNQLLQLCSMAFETSGQGSEPVLWCLRTLVKVYIHVPYLPLPPLFPGVPKSENFLLFTCVHIRMVEALFNSQIHDARRCFQAQEKPWSTLGLGGEWGSVPRFDDLIMYLHGFHWQSLLYHHFNSLVYYIRTGRRKVAFKFSFH